MPEELFRSKMVDFDQCVSDVTKKSGEVLSFEQKEKWIRLNGTLLLLQDTRCRLEVSVCM